MTQACSHYTAAFRLMCIVLVAGQAVYPQTQSAWADLLSRSCAALEAIPHATTALQASRQSEVLRHKIENSLALTRPAATPSRLPAILYGPHVTDRRLPAIIIVRPDEDPEGLRTRREAIGIARLGFVILILDLRAYHDAVDRLTLGVSPQSLIQNAARSAIGYLRTLPVVDGRHIGLLGRGTAGAITAAINPELAPVVLEAGPIDYQQYLRRYSFLTEEFIDRCHLVPGMLRYASGEEIVSMIAPRRLLMADNTAALADYSFDLYRSFNAIDSFTFANEPPSVESTNMQVIPWLRRQREKETASSEFVDSEISVLRIDLPSTKTAQEVERRQLTADNLSTLLGGALPAGTVNYGLMVANEQKVRLNVQPGIDLSVTVLRSGLGGSDMELGSLVVIDDRGVTAALSERVVQEALRRKWLVWAVDPRGTEELRVRPSAMFGISLMLGEYCVWRQAADLRLIIDRLGRDTLGRRVALYARGQVSSIIAAFVAFQADDERPEWVLIEDGIGSWHNTVNLSLYAHAYDALRMFDIQDLINASNAKRRTVFTRVQDVLETNW